MVNERILAQANRALAQTFQVGLLFSGLVFGSAVAQAQTGAPSDTQIQTAVSSALAADPQLHGQQVSASVTKGVVTLSGSVADDTQRTAAEQTVAQVTGVRSIDDAIAVGSQTASPNAPATQDLANAAPTPQDTAGQAPAPQAQSSQAQAAPMPPAAEESNSGSMPPPPPADTAQQQGQYPQQQQSQYPQQSGAYQGYPAQPRGYQSQAPYYGQQGSQYQGQYQGQYQAQPYVPGVAPERQNTSGPVTLNPGLLLNVRTSEPLSTSRLKDGEFVQFTAASDVYQNGVVAIPRGAVLTGQVVEAKNAGAFGGSPKLDLKLTTLTLGNQTYPLESDVWSSQGPSKTGYTAANTVGGAAFGAIIGAVAGGGVGAGVGAIAGGTGGALISGATHGPRLDLPAEAMLQFHLTAPLTVQPVNYNEAARLATTVPQQPVLRTRPVYVASPYGYYGRPYYPYPAPYYYGRY